MKYIRSFLALRKSVGIIGILLPFILLLFTYIIDDIGIQSSISHYYYTSMRDVFVGTLCAIALFMFYYTGYDEMDNWTGNLAGILALCVAWFPTPELGCKIDWIGRTHFISATLLFLALSFFSIYLFTKTNLNKEITPRKKLRNKIYVACGIVMLLCLITLAYIFYKDIDEKSTFPYVYWGETIALIAFGISWLVKGKFVLKDNKID